MNKNIDGKTAKQNQDTIVVDEGAELLIAEEKDLALHKLHGVQFLNDTAPKTDEAADTNSEAIVLEKHVLEDMALRKDISALYKYCLEIKAVGEKLDRDLALDLFCDRVMLMSVNLGSGINSYSAMYYEFLMEENLLPGEGGGAEVHLSKNPELGLGLDDAKRFIMEVAASMYAIDISEFIEDISSESFREFLLFLYAHAERFRYVFRVPYIEKREIRRIASVISDIFTLDIVAIPPINQQYMRESVQALLSSYGFLASEEAMDVVEERIAQEKSDGRFYGIDTLTKIVREMVLEKIAKSEDAKDSLILAKDIRALLAHNEVKRNAEEMLKSRVRIAPIWEKLSFVLSDIEHDEKGENYYNIAFIGNKGTGKSSTAQLFSKILKERGILSGSGFLEYGIHDLLGDVPGETVAKVMTACRDAEGCVLCIDMASLPEEGIEEEIEDSAPKRDDRKECIETLLSVMQERKNSFILIISCDAEEFTELSEIYPEITVLFPYCISFPDYTKEELYALFLDMLEKDNLEMSALAKQSLKEYIFSLSEKFLQSEQFANARFIRNLYDACKSKLDLRLELFQDVDREITESDVSLVTSCDARLLNQKEVKKYPMGFHLRDL